MFENAKIYFLHYKCNILNTVVFRVVAGSGEAGRLKLAPQGSQLSMKLQESYGLVSTENLVFRPWIWKSPKLSKLKQKKNLCDHNFDKLIFILDALY